MERAELEEQLAPITRDRDHLYERIHDALMKAPDEGHCHDGLRAAPAVLTTRCELSARATLLGKVRPRELSG
jgi:hypothetical protein